MKIWLLTIFLVAVSGFNAMAEDKAEGFDKDPKELFSEMQVAAKTVKTSKESQPLKVYYILHAKIDEQLNALAQEPDIYGRVDDDAIVLTRLKSDVKSGLKNFVIISSSYVETSTKVCSISATINASAESYTVDASLLKYIDLSTLRGAIICFDKP